MSEGITLLGATGSIGCSTLDVLARHPDRFHVVALSAHSNMDLLARQCRQTGAQLAICSDPACTDQLDVALKSEGAKAEIMSGPAALEEAVALPQTDTVMAAIVGAAGLQPTLKAVQLGKRVLLANKESMVIAGPLFEQALASGGGDLIPVDSEHNALFQALPDHFRDGLEKVGVDRLILTASGGPFLHSDIEFLRQVTPEQACAHPNWDMGRKISVDSATLMNKGLELIEARWLFNAQPDQLDVVVHPQSIVHSLVEYRDGSVLAQLGMPDMRTPIAHALAWPERITAGVERLDLARAGRLDFFPADTERFPCLRLAFEAMRSGGTAPAALNAANEVAVESFLNGVIPFMHIPELVEETLNAVDTPPADNLESVLLVDEQARRAASLAIEGQVKIYG